MPTLVVTKSTGGTAKPQGSLYVEPDRQKLDPGAPTSLGEAGLDAGFTVDLLSACLAHERCGAALYRAVAGRTRESALRDKYEEFGRETVDHVALLEVLIESTGGDPQYVSPAARATERADGGLLESTFVLAGSLDGPTQEFVLLEAVLLAEAKDHSNWELLARLAEVAGSPVDEQLRSVAATVLAQEVDHYGWARDTRMEMLFGLATGGQAPRPDDSIDLTKDDLYAHAKELEIEGRSSMSKDELAAAIAAREGAKA